MDKQERSYSQDGDQFLSIAQRFGGLSTEEEESYTDVISTALLLCHATMYSHEHLSLLATLILHFCCGIKSDDVFIFEIMAALFPVREFYDFKSNIHDILRALLNKTKLSEMKDKTLLRDLVSISPRVRHAEVRNKTISEVILSQSLEPGFEAILQAIRSQAASSAIPSITESKSSAGAATIPSKIQPSQNTSISRSTTIKAEIPASQPLHRRIKPTSFYDDPGLSSDDEFSDIPHHLPPGRCLKEEISTPDGGTKETWGWLIPQDAEDIDSMDGSAEEGSSPLGKDEYETADEGESPVKGKGKKGGKQVKKVKRASKRGRKPVKKAAQRVSKPASKPRKKRIIVPGWEIITRSKSG